MAGDLTETGELFSVKVGLIYVFNLIVGTGALTMPKAFSEAGWLVSVIIVVLLAVMSYLTVTFVIESMAAANAVRKINRFNVQPGAAVGAIDGDSEEERRPLLGESNTDAVRRNSNLTNRGYFDITERIEMGQMASMFFNKVGVWVFYICMVVYLYGDLAIYAAAVPKSLRDVACTYKVENSTNNSSDTRPLSDSDPCWSSQPHLNRMDAYRIFLGAFTLILGPFVFFNVQKTKYLQYFTTLMRWLAFSMMIILAVIRLAKGQGEGRPSVANISGIPTLFGVCVYSFMCHHSLPSLATPIRDKSKLYPLFAGDYTLILIFYCLLSLTGVFSFNKLNDLYTLNFQPSNNPITDITFIQYFLVLFPVFTLSTNFPIIGVTLRNNLKTMCLREGVNYHCLIDRILFPLLTLIPPTIVAFITNEVDFLVGVTGSYAGAAIQYFVPAALVFCARRSVSQALGPDAVNQHTSPFKHRAWCVLVMVWGSICVIFVTVNHIITGK